MLEHLDVHPAVTPRAIHRVYDRTTQNKMDDVIARWRNCSPPRHNTQGLQELLTIKMLFMCARLNDTWQQYFLLLFIPCG